MTSDELDSLYALARQFDEKPRSDAKPPGRTSAKTGNRPGDLFNESATWDEILEPHGWSYLFTSNDDREHWSRPGKEPFGTSATISPDGECLHVFSTSTPFDSEKSYHVRRLRRTQSCGGGRQN